MILPPGPGTRATRSRRARIGRPLAALGQLVPGRESRAARPADPLVPRAGLPARWASPVVGLLGEPGGRAAIAQRLEVGDRLGHVRQADGLEAIAGHLGADVARVEPLRSMKEHEDLPGGLDDFQKQIDELAAACESESNDRRRANLERNLDRYRALRAEAPNLRIVHPNTVFEGTPRLAGSKRSVDLVEVKRAHTASDVYLSIPDAGVVFMGDLGFFDTIPFLLYADPLGWIAALRTLEASDAATFVPGHGVVADADRVRLSRECIEAIVAVVREAQASGEEIDGIWDGIWGHKP